MPCKKLIGYLDENNVKYIVITHSQAFTAQQVAASTHIKGQNMAKSVVIKIEGKLAMAVLPANYQVDFQLLKEVSGSEHVELAHESEFRDRFEDCEPGAMPPFGNLYGLDVFVAATLAEDEEIGFNAGNHSELIKMSYPDFARLANPRVVKFSMH